MNKTLHYGLWAIIWFMCGHVSREVAATCVRAAAEELERKEAA